MYFSVLVTMTYQHFRLTHRMAMVVMHPSQARSRSRLKERLREQGGAKPTCSGRPGPPPSVANHNPLSPQGAPLTT